MAGYSPVAGGAVAGSSGGGYVELTITASAATVASRLRLTYWSMSFSAVASALRVLRADRVVSAAKATGAALSVSLNKIALAVSPTVATFKRQVTKAFNYAATITPLIDVDSARAKIIIAYVSAASLVERAVQLVKTYSVSLSYGGMTRVFQLPYSVTIAAASSFKAFRAYTFLASNVVLSATYFIYRNLRIEIDAIGVLAVNAFASGFKFVPRLIVATSGLVAAATPVRWLNRTYSATAVTVLAYRDKVVERVAEAAASVEAGFERFINMSPVAELAAAAERANEVMMYCLSAVASAVSVERVATMSRNAIAEVATTATAVKEYMLTRIAAVGQSGILRRFINRDTTATTLVIATKRSLVSVTRAALVTLVASVRAWSNPKMVITAMVSAVPSFLRRFSFRIAPATPQTTATFSAHMDAPVIGDANDIMVVPAEDRAMKVPHEDRVMIVPAENRSM